MSLNNTESIKQKRVYHVIDWKSYNKGLSNRYNLDLWFNPQLIKKWYHKPKIRKVGATKTYSKKAILTCFQLKCLFGLTLRATQGFLDSLFHRLNLPIKCPHYSQLSRRAKDLRNIKLPISNNNSMLFALVDSTGLKVYGQGEWHVKIHKASRRRTWRKLNLLVDPISQEIIDNNLTASNIHDAKAALPLLSKLPDSFDALWGDGAYDSSSIYQTLFEKNIKPIIPPQRNAILSRQNFRKRRHLGHKSLIQNNPSIAPRDSAIEYINLFPDKDEGRREWKRHSSYHLRSLVETAMMRFKQTFSDKLKARTFCNQQAEVRVKCSILNKMIQIASANSTPTTNFLKIV
jgi:hypothetical protein